MEGLLGDSKVDLDPSRIILAPGVNPRGSYANAIRVIRESDQESVLDFLLYSPVDSSAEIVARVRVTANFLTTLQRRLVEESTATVVKFPPTSEKN